MALRRAYFAFLLLGCALLLLSGCSSFVDVDQAAVDPAMNAQLAPGHPVGQSFVARHGGLNGIRVWLQPKPGSQGVLRLHLRESADMADDLASASMALDPAENAPQFYQFVFSPLDDSNNRYFYASLEYEGSGMVDLGAAAAGSYRDGSLYLDGRPAADGQLAFELSYDRSGQLRALAHDAFANLTLLALVFLVFVIPGSAAVLWLVGPDRPSWPEIAGLAGGLSMAFYTLWLLWTDAVGIRLGILNVWLPAGIGVLGLVLYFARHGAGDLRSALRAWIGSQTLWPDLALALAVLLVFGVRLLVIAGLDAPSWGDSVQHAAITQLILDHGGLFTSWEPYAPFRTLSVHFGFSGFAALLAWATGSDGTRGTLLAGQLVNGISILALYPLATRLAGGKRWAGVAAVVVGGLISPMPAYYVNWGRFAQLSGQAVLPVALWFFVDVLERKRLAWGSLVLAGLTAAGMSLNYYRMPYYYAVFVLAWLIGYGLPHWKVAWRTWLVRLLWLAAIGIITILLIFPYRSHLLGTNLEAGVSSGLSGTPPVAGVLSDYQIWRDLAFYVPRGLQACAVLAVLWSLWRRRWVMAAVGLWIIGLAALVASMLIHVPGANKLQNFAILIALYIPVCILAGWLAAELSDWISPRLGRVGPVAIATVLLATALWGARGQVNIVNPEFIMVNRPDTRAMAWIRANTPADARFLVEGFRIYSGQSAVGSDAGWWIPLLARRSNTMPPQYALVNEIPETPGYVEGVVNLVAQMEKNPPTAPEVVRQLCERRITHVYIGQGQGQIGAGAVPLYKTDQFSGSHLYHLVYSQDRVRIFALDPSACQDGANGGS